MMGVVRRHWPRIVITLLPVLLALAHATGAWQLSASNALTA
jgi:adenylate cyclase